MFQSKIPDIHKEADGEIKKERESFKPIVETLINYVKEHKLCFSNPEWMATDVLPDVFSVWSPDALVDANNITNEIYSKNCKVVFMKTNVPYMEFEISVLGRRFIRVNGYPRVRAMKTDKLFKTVEHKGIAFMDPEIELIDIYHQLYAPWPDEWPTAQILEAKMFDIHDTKGGDAKHDFNAETHSIRASLFDQLATSDMGILVGQWAYKEISGKTPQNEKLQLLVPSGWTPDIVVQKLENLLRGVTKYKLSYKTEDVFIPKDLWLKRTTYYFNIGDKRAPIVDSYNSQDYEMVPYNLSERGVKIGNPFVICRFLMIDRWVISVLVQLGVLNAQSAKNKIASIYRTIADIRTREGFGDQYDGVYKDINVEKRKFIKEQEGFRSYVPYQYEQKFGKLRTV